MLLRSLVFYMGLISTMMLMVPFSLLIFPFPFAKRYYFATRWTAFNLWWLKITCDLTHSIEGLENIPTNASIIMSKHQSAWETLAIQLIFPIQVWIVKRELLWIPVYGWGLASMQPITIDRSSAIKAFIKIVKQGCERFAKGYWVVIFPEGTRVAPGQTKKYLPGGGMLAKKSGVSIIPVAHNAGYFWPRNSITKKSGTIQMVIGPAIDPDGKTAIEITNEVEKWIEDTVNKLPKPD